LEEGGVVKEKERELFMALARDPLAGERLKALPPGQYRRTMRNYAKWRRRVEGLIPSADIPRIFSRCQI
jgi:hypothetical protein